MDVVASFTALHSDSRSSCVIFVSSSIANYDNEDLLGEPDAFRRDRPVPGASALSGIGVDSPAREGLFGPPTPRKWSHP